MTWMRSFIHLDIATRLRVSALCSFLVFVYVNALSDGTQLSGGAWFTHLIMVALLLLRFSLWVFEPTSSSPDLRDMQMGEASTKALTALAQALNSQGQSTAAGREGQAARPN